jgi:hypothetical protein
MVKQLRLIIFILFIFCTETVFSQYERLNQVVPSLNVSFVKQKLVVSPSQSFFNIVRIKNTSTQTQIFTLNFIIPEKWTLFDMNYDEIKLQPGDSVKIPLRISVSESSKGSVAYPVVASIANQQGQIIGYNTFITSVPQKNDLKVKPIETVRYWDSDKGYAKFNFLIENRGNVNEVVNFSIKTDNNVFIPNEANNLYSTAVFVPAQTDSIFTILAFIKTEEEAQKRLFHPITVNVVANEKSANYNLWIKNLKTSNIYPVPENYKMLKAELMAKNIFKDFSPIYTASVSGNLLLPRNRTLGFYYRNYDNRLSLHNLWKYSQLVVKYRDSKKEIILGDIMTNFEQSVYGRGVYTNLKIDKTNLATIITRNMLTGNNNAGLIVSHPVSQKFTPEIGGVYVFNNENRTNTKLYLTGTTFSLKSHRLRLRYFLTQKDYNSKIGVKTGWGITSTYSGEVKNLRLSLNTRMGTPEFAGISRGLLELNGYANYVTKNKDYFALKYSRNWQKPNNYSGDSLLPRQTVDYQQISLEIGTTPRPSFYLYMEPNMYIGKTNTYYINSPKLFVESSSNMFTANIAQLKFGVKYRDARNIYFHPYISFGYGNILEYKIVADTNLNKSLLYEKKHRTFQAGFSLYNLNGGIFTNYYNGPQNIFEQYSAFYTNYNTHYIRITPYYKGSLFNKKVDINSQLSYFSNFTSEVIRVNFSNNLTYHINENWAIRYLNNLSWIRTIDIKTKEKFRTSYIYHEIGISREFLTDQPRYKLCKLKVKFFLDLNGNRVCDINEPGVKNVLVNVERDVTSTDYENVGGNFTPIELLSDFNGEVEYQNIPSGNYKFNFTPLDKTGNYITDKKTDIYTLEKNKTVEIPFFENYKIFGHISMIRAALSSLGTIDVSNIRIIAKSLVDSTIYPALTDANGNFTIYVPHGDAYEVTINDIFYENFNLQQNNYRIFFNGFKQYELTFVFVEKERKISFDEDFANGGIKTVNRASLRGIVKDMGDLKPIGATIEIVNVTGKVISSTITNRETGNYSIIFLSGDDYMVNIKAESYETYSEPLYLDQVSSFQILTKNYMLKKNPEIKKK